MTQEEALIIFRQIMQLCKKIEQLEARIAELEKHSHPPIDWTPTVDRITKIEDFLQL